MPVRSLVRPPSLDPAAMRSGFATDVAAAVSLAARRSDPRSDDGRASRWTVAGASSLGYIEAERDGTREVLRFRSPDGAATDPDVLLVGPEEADRWTSFDHADPERSLDETLSRWTAWASDEAETDPSSALRGAEAAIDLMERYLRTAHDAATVLVVGAPTAHRTISVRTVSGLDVDVPESDRISAACDALADPVVTIVRSHSSGCRRWEIGGQHERAVHLAGTPDPLEAMRILSSVQRR